MCTCMLLSRKKSGTEMFVIAQVAVRQFRQALLPEPQVSRMFLCHVYVVMFVYLVTSIRA